MRTRTAQFSPLLVLAFLAFVVIVPAAAAEVRLGSANFWEGEYDEGFGEERPARIYNGGVPSGLILNVVWKSWGGPVALGTAEKPIYKPGGGYFRQGARVRLKARGLGTCPGEPGSAYHDLLIRTPLWPGGPAGPWLAWNGNKSLCGDGSPSDWVEPPGGYCGYTGEYGEPGEVATIMASKVGCPIARAVAKRSEREVSPSRYYGPRRYCGRKGCRVRLRGFRCRFHRLHPTDYTDGEGGTYPAYQRVACKRGQASVIYWYLRWD